MTERAMDEADRVALEAARAAGWLNDRRFVVGVGGGVVHLYARTRRDVAGIPAVLPGDVPVLTHVVGRFRPLGS